MNNCPYCQSTATKKSYLEDTFFNDKTFSYLQCKKCSVIYIDPFPDQSDYEVMYPVEYQGEIFQKATQKYFRLFEQIKIYRPGAKTILDYGCGNAELICDAKAFGFVPSGVEYSPVFITEVRKRNPEIDFFTIDDFHQKNNDQYDIIVMNNVLEHLTNPNEILQQLKDKLNENGLLICLGPIENNFTLALFFRKMIFGIRKKILNKKATHVPYHISFTNVENQKMIFVQNKLKELYFSTEEVAWPFPEKINYKSPKSILFASIAKISMGISKLFSKTAGNTFLYIGTKSGNNYNQEKKY
ncbi:MAG: class I SAM-dependent methyltransferase [Flavobacteriia bacterium]